MTASYSALVATTVRSTRRRLSRLGRTLDEYEDLYLNQQKQYNSPRLQPN
jgi:hypothetical protein